MNDFFGVIRHPPLEISMFYHMLDRVCISGKERKKLVMTAQKYKGDFN